MNNQVQIIELDYVQIGDALDDLADFLAAQAEGEAPCRSEGLVAAEGRLDAARGALKDLEAMKGRIFGYDGPTAAVEALDKIAALSGCSEWDYPGRRMPLDLIGGEK